MLLYKKITALCCTAFLLAGVSRIYGRCRYQYGSRQFIGDAASGAEEK